MNKSHSELPCIACPTMCENIFALYNAYHLFEPEVKVQKMGLQCHKTGLHIEIDLREYSRRVR